MTFPPESYDPNRSFESATPVLVPVGGGVDVPEEQWAIAIAGECLDHVAEGNPPEVAQAFGEVAYHVAYSISLRSQTYEEAERRTGELLAALVESLEPVIEPDAGFGGQDITYDQRLAAKGLERLGTGDRGETSGLAGGCCRPVDDRRPSLYEEEP